MQNRHDSQPRFRPKVGILVGFVAGATAGRGVVGDVSSDGVFIQTRVLPPPGTRIHVTLREPGNRPIDVEGEVHWSVERAVQAGDNATGFGVALRRYPAEYLVLVERIAKTYVEGDKD